MLQLIDDCFDVEKVHDGLRHSNNPIKVYHKNGTYSLL